MNLTCREHAVQAFVTEPREAGERLQGEQTRLEVTPQPRGFSALHVGGRLNRGSAQVGVKPVLASEFEATLHATVGLVLDGRQRIGEPSLINQRPGTSNNRG